MVRYNLAPFLVKLTQVWVSGVYTPRVYLEGVVHVCDAKVVGGPG